MMINSGETKLLMLRLGPLICRIVGFFFILSGVAALAVGSVVAIKRPGNEIIGFVLLGTGVLDVLIGVAFVRYLPSFMVSRLERQLQ